MYVEQEVRPTNSGHIRGCHLPKASAGWSFHIFWVNLTDQLIPTDFPIFGMGGSTAKQKANVGFPFV
jgi:hypothetical protein